MNHFPDKEKLVAELFETREELAYLRKREREITEFLKTLGTETIKAGNFIVTQKEITRRDLDREAVLRAYGDNFLDQFMKTSTYLRLDIVKDSA